MPLYIKHNDEWKSLPRPYVKHGGAWKQTEQVYVNHDGEWKKIFPEGFVYFSGANHESKATIRRLNPETGAVEALMTHGSLIGHERTNIAIHPTLHYLFQQRHHASLMNPQTMGGVCGVHVNRYLRVHYNTTTGGTNHGLAVHPTEPWVFVWMFYTSGNNTYSHVVKLDYENMVQFFDYNENELRWTWQHIGDNHYMVGSYTSNRLYIFNGFLYAGRGSNGLRKINMNDMSTDAQINFSWLSSWPTGTGSHVISFADDGTNLFLGPHNHGIMKVNPNTLDFIDGYECNKIHAMTYGGGYIYAGVDSPREEPTCNSRIIKVNPSNMTLVDELDTIGTIRDLAYDDETDSIYSSSLGGTVHKIKCSDMSITWTHSQQLSRAVGILYHKGFPTSFPGCP